MTLLLIWFGVVLASIAIGALWVAWVETDGGRRDVATTRRRPCGVASDRR